MHLSEELKDLVSRAFAALHDGLRRDRQYCDQLAHILSKDIGALTDDECNEIWSVAQHHGSCTPLLDWSKSPYVALFFAAVENLNLVPDGRTHFAIWGLSLERFHGGFYASFPQTSAKFEAFVPRATLPARMAAQQAVFTRTSPDAPMDDLASWVYSIAGPYPILYKVTMPVETALSTVIHLNRMNVNHITLFPDTEGIAKFAGVNMTSPKYTGMEYVLSPYGMNGATWFQVRDQLISLGQHQLWPMIN